jgi:hypothetical protein
VKDYHINIFWSDEDGGSIADIPDLEASSAFGANPQEALAEPNGPRRLGWRRPVPKASRSRSLGIALPVGGLLEPVSMSLMSPQASAAFSNDPGF